MPLSNFAPRGFGFVHHSIAILYHQVPNPNITIRDFFIAVCPAVQEQEEDGVEARRRPTRPPRVTPSAAAAAARAAEQDSDSDDDGNIVNLRRVPHLPLPALSLSLSPLARFASLSRDPSTAAPPGESDRTGG